MSRRQLAVGGGGSEVLVRVGLWQLDVQAGLHRHDPGVGPVVGHVVAVEGHGDRAVVGNERPRRTRGASEQVGQDGDASRPQVHR